MNAPASTSMAGEAGGLPALLRSATWPLHAEVERAGLMRRLLAGRIERTDYVALLQNLGAIYAALEPLLLQHRADPALAPIHDPALHRTVALRADLRFLAGAVPRAPALARATQTYVERLHEIGRCAPRLLAAHAYVRYLGDLSGGQALQRVVGRALRLPGPDGLRFYDFGDAAAVARRAQVFRQGLAAIRLDDAAAAELVAEAQRAFALHGDLFRELDTAPGGPSAPPSAVVGGLR